MRRSKLIAGLGMLTVIAGYITYTITAVGMLTGPTEAEQQADRMGIEVFYVDYITPDDPDDLVVGHYYKGEKLYVLEGLDREKTNFVIWHEIGHYLSDKYHWGWSEEDADAYAESMTD